MRTFDLIVIGGGRAATLAIEAAKAGQRVALVEKERLGGTCPNRGCVPSKLLIGYADVAHRIRAAARHKIDAKIESVDVAEIFQDVNEWIEAVDPRYEGRLPMNVCLFRGEGKFVANKVVEVKGEQLSAENIVIATGARSRPSGFEGLPVWTSDDLFPFNKSVPKSIAIVGGGFIACELGNFFQQVGVETTMLVRGGGLLPQEDETIAKVFSEQYTESVPTKFNTVISSIQYNEGFVIELEEKVTGKTGSLEVDALLFATGRIPNTESLGLDVTSVTVNARGFIQRDENLETAVKGVYAAGDVGGDFQLQHAASYEISYLVDKLVKGKEGVITFPQMPHAVFSEPEVAAVGITEQALRDREDYDDFVVVEVDWRTSARMLSWRIDYPLTKMIVRKSDFSIAGCHMIGPESSTMIHQVLMLMHLKNDVREIGKMVHIHPSLSECLLAATAKAIEEIMVNQS